MYLVVSFSYYTITFLIDTKGYNSVSFGVVRKKYMLLAVRIAEHFTLDLRTSF